MAESSWPWEGTTTGDAGPYSDDIWSIGWAALFYGARNSVMVGNGDELLVEETTPNSNSVEVLAGLALIEGKIYRSTATETLTISANGSGNDRIDTVVVTVDWSAQTATLEVVEGTPAGSPSPPALTQTNGTEWQFPLADVYAANGFATITNANITDRRIFGHNHTVGELSVWSTDTAPSGAVLCDGSAISRTIYSDLFGVIGTDYGVGDGSTTFNVPDLRGRVPLTLDNLGGSSANRVTSAQADSINGSAGAEDHTLDTTEIPAHTHPGDSGYNYFMTKAGGAQQVGIGAGAQLYATPANTGQNTGGGGAHNNMQPYLTMASVIWF